MLLRLVFVLFGIFGMVSAWAGQPLAGFGSVTSGGAGGEVRTVTTLADSGPGSLRAHLSSASRNYVSENILPLRIVFDETLGGEITLLSDIVIRTPFITIDGATAGPPGITIKKNDTGPDPLDIGTEGSMILAYGNGAYPAGAHDIIIRNLRFDGDWPMNTQVHNQNSTTLGIDGDGSSGVRNIVLDHNSFVRGTDSSPDIWGSAWNITYSNNIFMKSLHPVTITFSDASLSRNFLSLFRNVFALNHERNPQIRGNVKYLEFVNNIVFNWGAAPGGGGYGVRLRDRDGVYPRAANFINNYFQSQTHPGSALYFGNSSSDMQPSLPGIHVDGNFLPSDNVEGGSSSPGPFVIDPDDPEVPAGRYDSDYNPVPVLSLQQVYIDVLDTVGPKFRNAEEEAVIDDIRSSMEADLGIETFVSWIEQYDGSVPLMSDDSDYDGIPALLEYAFNLDPQVSDTFGASLPSVEFEGGQLKVTFRRHADKADLAYEVQTGSDLKSWTSISRSEAGSVTTSEFSGVSIEETGSGEIVVEVSEPQGSEQARFLRVKVIKK